MKSYLIVSVFLISIFSSFNTQAFSLKKGVKKLGKGLERTARGVRDTGKTVVNVVEYVGNKATGDDESAAKAKERMKENGHDAVKNLGKGLERTFGGAMDTITSVVGTAFCPKETIGKGYCVEGGVECDYSSEGTQCALTDSAGNRSEVPETQELEIEWDQALAWVRENEMRDFFQQQNYDLIDGTLDMIFPDQESKHRFFQLAQYTERILYDGTNHGTKIPEGGAQQQLVLSLSKFLQDIENQKGNLKFEPHSIDRSRNPSGVIAMTAIGLLTVYSIYMESTREVKGDEIHSTYIIEDILGIGSLIKAGITSISGLRATIGSATKLGIGNKKLGKLMGTLREARHTKGMFGLGKASRNEAKFLGESFVGPNYRVASDGKTLISADGLKQYRPPSYKSRLRKTQANFEWRKLPNGKLKNNGHLDIID